MDDDVTIEDEFESNQQILSKPEIKPNLTLFEILSEQWIYLLILSIVALIIIYLYRNRKEYFNSRVVSSHTEDDYSTRYQQIERIREKQQKDYEEQCLRHAQQKKEKMDNSKKSVNEECKPLKYLKSDHNPLTGQSNSCSWRPSKRKGGAGG